MLPKMRVASSTLKTIVRAFSSREKEFLVINSVGVDRPGIVSGITKHVVDAGGSIGASQAAKLGSHFGLMMLVSVPKDQSVSLQKSLANVDDMSTVCYVTVDPKAVSIQPRDGCKYFRHVGHKYYDAQLL
jgi:predicted amino acid-binding ACT domain protein